MSSDSRSIPELKKYNVLCHSNHDNRHYILSPLAYGCVDDTLVDSFPDCNNDFISPSLWPLNSPDLNPVDYKIWNPATSTKLRERIVAVREAVDQRVIDLWRERLLACVKAKWGHFEHFLK